MSSRASDDDAFEASTEHSSLLKPKKGPGVAVEDEQPSKRKGALRTITKSTVISALAIAFIVMAVLVNRSSYGDIDLSEGLTASNYYTERDGQFATMCVALASRGACHRACVGSHAASSGIHRYPWADQYTMVEPHIDTTLSISDKAFKSMGSDVAWEVRRMPLSVICAGDPPVSISLSSAQEVGHRLRIFSCTLTWSPTCASPGRA